MSETRSYPRQVKTDSGDIEFRLMSQADEAAVLALAQKLPSHDLLFLPRNISQPEVLSAWINEIKCGVITSPLAVKAGTVVGCGTLVRDPHSWSPHVGQGVGRALSQETFALALGAGLERLSVQMTVDQGAAIALFEIQGRGTAARPCPGRRRQDAQHRRDRAQCGAGPGPDGSLWVTRGCTALSNLSEPSTWGPRAT
jgi:hypothetical protein